MELSEISLNYLKNSKSSHRKKLGQYFTPQSIREVLFKKLPKIKDAKILEPSCGTGEFVKDIFDHFENPTVDAIELDKKLFETVRQNFSGFRNLNFHNADTLKKRFNEKYDFVIGNPPYFEMQPSVEIKKKFKDVIKGRTNIYGLFVKLGLDLLKENGYLAYVIPMSMNNGAYFSKLREYIANNAEIVDIVSFGESEFKDAQQSVMILILKKIKNTGKFIFKKDGLMIFSKNCDELNTAFENKKSLKELGFAVKTGSIVWNQNKRKLSNNDANTKLIWAHNIGDGKIELNNKKRKKQFIKNVESENKNAIVVNRIIGVGDGVKIRAAIMKKRDNWQAENHVNVIFKKSGRTAIRDLKEILEQIVSPEMLKIIKSISGNTQLSKTELENLIPITMKEKKDE